MKRIHDRARSMYRAAHGAARGCSKSGNVAGYMAMVRVLRLLTRNWNTGLELIPFRLGKPLRTASGNVVHRLDGPYLSGRRFLRRI